jgi:hypothetical protein
MIDTIIAGDALDFSKTITDSDGNAYLPSDGWALTYRLVPRSSGPSVISIATTADGEQFRAEVTSATTAAWTAGTYTAFAILNLSSEYKTIEIGECVIRANPRTATTYDGRSDARVAYDALLAAYQSYVTSQGTVAEYEIAGRRMKFASADQILKHLALAKSEWLAEEKAARLAAGLGSGTKVLTRFAR